MSESHLFAASQTSANDFFNSLWLVSIHFLL